MAGFVHNGEAQLIAGFIKFRILGVMGGADGVAAHIPEPLQAVAVEGIGEGGSYSGVVVMEADTLQLHRLAV